MTEPYASDPRWERLETLYEQAVALPEAERAAFIERECGDDDALRRELASLLAFSPTAEEFFTRIGGDVRDAIADRLPELPDERIGTAIRQYRIEARLGAGGMGVVYRAYDTQLRRIVALKLLPAHLSDDDRARDRFLNEARAVAALDHPNICAIHETGESESGAPFIAMAFCDGETLKSRIARGPLPLGEAMEIAAQMARGLAVAHGRGIVHRDIKPGNVILTEGGLVKLVDFGLARLPDVTLTAPGLTPGTAAYMAPEQLRGERIDVRADLWSLGIVLYEMLSGVRPFDGDSNASIGHAVTNDEPVPLAERRPDLAPAAAEIVERLLEKDREQRYRNADDVLEDLIDTLTVGHPVRMPARRPRKRTSGPVSIGRRGMGPLRRWARAGVGAMVIGLAAWQLSVGLRSDPVLAPPRAIILGILPIETNAVTARFEPLKSTFMRRLATDLSERGVDIRSTNTIASWIARGAAPDSISSALGVDYLVETTLTPGAADTINAGLFLHAEGLLQREVAELPVADYSSGTAESLGRQAAIRILNTLQQEIREASLQRGASNVAADGLRRKAAHMEAMARRNLTASGRVAAATADSLLALAERQLDSAQALLVRSSGEDPDWAVPRLEQARLSEWRVVIVHARSGGSADLIRVYDDAIAAVDEVLRRTPDDALARGLRGRLRWRRAQLASTSVSARRSAVVSAAADLRAATDAEPGLARPAADLAEIMFDEYGDYIQAASYAETAYENDQYGTNAPIILDHLARSLFELDRDEDAAEKCSDGLRDYPEQPTHYLCYLDVMAWGTLRIEPDAAWAHYHRLVERTHPRNVLVRVYAGFAVAAILARTPGIRPDSARAVLTRVMATVNDSLSSSERSRLGAAGLESAVWFRLNDRARALALYAVIQKEDSARARLMAGRRLLREFVTAVTNSR